MASTNRTGSSRVAADAASAADGRSNSSIQRAFTVAMVAAGAPATLRPFSNKAARFSGTQPKAPSRRDTLKTRIR